MGSDEPALLRRVLGPSFESMPAEMRALHDVPELQLSRGTCSVRRGRHPMARFLAALLSLPPACEAATIRVVMRREGNSEVWIRQIAGRRFESRLTALGPGRLGEQIACLGFEFRTVADAAGYCWTLAGMRLLGLPLPRALWPEIKAREWVEAERVRFDIAASLPLIGDVVAYRGELSVDPAVPGETPGQPLMLFDGVCNFCNRGVDFLLKRDPYGRIRFAAMQSGPGRELLDKHGLPQEDYDTFIVLDGGQQLTKSAAVLHLLGYLSSPWSLLKILGAVPRPLRDLIYDAFARHRYRLMGKRKTCRMPTAEDRKRFLV